MIVANSGISASPTTIPGYGTSAKSNLTRFCGGDSNSYGSGACAIRTLSEETMKAPTKNAMSIKAGFAIALFAAFTFAQAETIKLGMSIPLSGAGANWGKGSEWLCTKAAEEIKAAGGVKVKDTAYNFECIGYDNKYNAAEGAK